MELEQQVVDTASSAPSAGVVDVKNDDNARVPKPSGVKAPGAPPLSLPAGPDPSTSPPLSVEASRAGLGAARHRLRY